jgi:lipopolysaccharide transport system ATP-binding protein
MSDTIITVENLSKKYLVGHQSGSRSRSNYTALRDVIAREIRNVARKTVDTVRGRQVVQGDEVEEFWALKNVGFEVKQGEVVGIIGRNGAGKSTLLKILSRITEPTTGRVVLRGRVASLLEVGTGFHPELTGRENIFLNGAILGMTRREIQKKFDEIVAFAEVEKFLDTPVKRFSSGMYVRLAFAVAAHLEPEILIVDEVLAVGDAEFQEKCLGKMKAVSGEGRTVLFVSHNMAAIRTLCSSGILLREGQTLFQGSASEAIATYVAYASLSTGSVWLRPDSLALSEIGFEKITISVIGAQPNLKLVCEIMLRCRIATPTSFIAVDIRDQMLSVIMQAVPNPTPFIVGNCGIINMVVEIFLPPLIPGLYTTDFWIGYHNIGTADYIPYALSFQVVQSPSAGRTYPHTIDHGSIVPLSDVLACCYSRESESDLPCPKWETTAC